VGTVHDCTNQRLPHPFRPLLDQDRCMDRRDISYGNSKRKETDTWAQGYRSFDSSSVSGPASPSLASPGGSPSVAGDAAASWYPETSHDRSYHFHSAPNSPLVSGGSGGAIDNIALSGHPLYRSYSHPASLPTAFTPLLSPSTEGHIATAGGSNPDGSQFQPSPSTGYSPSQVPSSSSTPSSSLSPWPKPLPPFNLKRRLPRHNPNTGILSEITSESGEFCS
jgi:hypothetical protein